MPTSLTTTLTCHFNHTPHGERVARMVLPARSPPDERSEMMQNVIGREALLEAASRAKAGQPSRSDIYELALHAERSAPALSEDAAVEVMAKAIENNLSTAKGLMTAAYRAILPHLQASQPEGDAECLKCEGNGWNWSEHTHDDTKYTCECRLSAPNPSGESVMQEEFPLYEAEAEICNILDRHEGESAANHIIDWFSRRGLLAPSKPAPGGAMGDRVVEEIHAALAYPSMPGGAIIRLNRALFALATPPAVAPDQGLREAAEQAYQALCFAHKFEIGTHLEGSIGKEGEAYFYANNDLEYEMDLARILLRQALASHPAATGGK